MNYPFLEKCFKHQLFIFKKYDNKNKIRNETLLMNFQDDFIKPYYDIIYNYSSEKERYLNQRGLYIPNEDIVTHYRAVFDTKKAENPKGLDKDEWDNLYNGLDGYEKILQYYALQERLSVQIPVNGELDQEEISSKKLKI